MSESDNWRVKKKLPSPSTSSNNVSDNKFTYRSSPNRPRKHGSGSAIQTQKQKTWNASGQRTNITHDASKAIEEGRRVYVGNMPYIAKRTDVEKLFEAYPVEHIDISIDPFTGRNLSYCFVELLTKEDAERAMERLNGQMFMGRPLKVRSGVPRGTRQNNDEENGVQDTPSQGVNRRPRRSPADFANNPAASLVFEGWERDDAEMHWKGYADQGRRLYVGGLPQMTTHRAVNDAVRDIFKGYELEAISKRITPNPPRPGNNYYVFVDFVRAQDAARAVKVFNGKRALGSVLRVSHATGNSRKVDERERWAENEEIANDEGRDTNN
ncbi:hypothetical protein EV359DRAFT_63400 [Lentinula novae-zelandiae]|nr:hypothetical protein EV359DRAFT_63400 [Lentinula novae-zelandiae]